MPFTVSHVAAVLPARWVGLPMSALAIGAMAPDIPYFLPGPSLGDALGGTHRPLGVIGIDLLLGLVAWTVWQGVVVEPAVTVTPRWVRARLPAGWRPGLAAALAAPGAPIRVVLAVVVGAASHVAWDAFTHVDAWGPAHVEVLRAEVVRGYTGARLAQYLSGVGGLAVVVLAIAWWAWRTPPRPIDAPAAAWWLAVPSVLVAGLAGLVGGVRTVRVGDGVRRAAFEAVTAAGAAAGVAALAMAVGWHLVGAVTRRDGSPAGR